MNTRFLTALKKYLEHQHTPPLPSFLSFTPRHVCDICYGTNVHTDTCPLGNLLTEIDNVLVQAVRKDLT